MANFSFVTNAHPTYIDQLYRQYQNDAEQIDAEWRKFFEGFDFALSGDAVSTNGAATQQDAAAIPKVSEGNTTKELQVYQLIQAYRRRGHLVADTNPIRHRRDRHERLSLDVFGLTESDLQEKFAIGSLIGLPQASLKDIIEKLKYAYTGHLGIEYMYINDPEKLAFFQERFESHTPDFGLSEDEKKRILRRLNEAVVFEKFLHTKYIGQKRFSLEGGESIIAGIDFLINEAADLGANEFIIGMAHRGRLNVLVNVMRKTYSQIFSEFEGNIPADLTMGDGDVKYHLGYRSQVKTASGKTVNLKLSPNPSHLEAVNPVVEGMARSKADTVYNSQYDQVMPILIHGDSAIAGQGVVYETVQMSKLEGYYTGGTIHLVINNQIGFTTNFDDARSANYCTSIAAMIEAPVIHVNGDDPEAVVYACRVAAQYRQQFNSDVFVDMVCYRRHGHNEGDDPKYTQPQMYAKINKHANPREVYINQLNHRGNIEKELADKLDKEFWQLLQDRLDEVREKPLPYELQGPELAWQALREPEDKDFLQSPITGISKDWVNTIRDGLMRVPEGFNPLRKINKMLDRRREIMMEKKTIDWAAAELMAYGSILLEGKDVRMSGQDVKRGTFSHRHAILFDEKTAEPYNRLNYLKPDEQGRFMIYNSLLSEFAVLGFEFGYSMTTPDTLTLWEAQFGDFVNGAQTIIDQFITSSDSKWQRDSGLVMLLPHGYEGQGPEHSSARLERFLQAAAEYNISVVNITDAANFFHCLRRQQHRDFRLPLIVMSPKSLLRHPEVESSIFDIIGDTRFHEILDDQEAYTQNAENIKRVLCCSGKFYYDLLAYRRQENIKDVALVRFEQLYPLHKETIEGVLGKYKNAERVWAQEEPLNMGAWSHLHLYYPDLFSKSIARKASASPATGYASVHKKEQAELVQSAFK